ncbi:hypothetical protein ULMA_18070 [Patiriisocius marinus]|uniref:Glycosyltransferase n=1 Tax=Patiriisocius marinus TaxID=1397112 RepID=A0A5J4IPR1_9FLAO|nr:hypothetical protein [Patiriisocius marinus]GER59699.1 hypothetical protein ULMA_18070 [Patiriisocius marinus]
MNFKKNIKGFYLYYKYSVRNFDQNKAILISIDEFKFNRYLYTFVKMLHLEGCYPVLDVGFESVAHLTTDMYSKNILSERLLFKNTKNGKYLKKIHLSPDYFTAVYNPSINNETVIPISKHPLMYGLDASHLALKENRKNAVFFAGTTLNQGHSKKQVFEGVINRVTVIDELKKLPQAILPVSTENYHELKATLKDGSIVICERDKLSFPPAKLLEELSSFSFYLALPGRGMPLCHNLTEALFLGCVPILQEVYSNTMPEPFQHLKNALVYRDVNHLKAILLEIEQMSPVQIALLKQESMAYYNAYLSEKALVKRVVESNNNKFYLQAEGYSIVKYKNTIQA